MNFNIKILLLFLEYENIRNSKKSFFAQHSNRPDQNFLCETNMAQQFNADASLQELRDLEEELRAKLLVAEKALQLYDRAVAAKDATLE